MLPAVALVFASGIGLGAWLALPVAPSLVVAVCAVALLAWARRRAALVGLATLSVALALGLVAQARARRPAPDALVEPPTAPRRVWQAVVESLPERLPSGTRLVLSLRAMERGGEVRAASGRVLVHVRALREPLLPGDRVRLRAQLAPPRGFLNPGGPDARLRAHANGIDLVAGVWEPAALVRMPGPPESGPLLSLLRAAGKLRERMRAAASRLPGDGGVLVPALVAGDRGDVPRDLDEAFRIAGVSHVLSVSGLHLAIAAYLFYGGLVRLLLRLPRVGRGRPIRRWAALAAIAPVIGYTVVTGAQVATVRACLVALLWLAAAALGRPLAAAQALALAALAILGVTPLALFDPSLQLSFAAALGTVLIAPRLLPQAVASWPLLLRAPLKLVAVSAAALLATSPIVAWHFSEVQPAGLFTNVIVVPLSELALLPFGFAGALLSALGLPGEPFLLAAGFSAEVTSAFVRVSASAFPEWVVARPPAAAVLLWFGGLVAFAFTRRRLLLLGGLAAALAVMGGAELARRHRTTLTAVFADVGQGDACLLELPGGRAVVVDGGGSFADDFDPGDQVLTPLLRRRGVRRIDLMVLSHPHPDHANGLATLVDRFPVGEIWTNGQETRQPGTLRLLAAAARRGVPVSRPRPLELGGVRIESLHEPRPGYSENDSSIVLRLSHGGRALLLPGDAEAAAEAALVARGGAHADVLKVPHHGSRTSSSDAFLDAVAPAVAVASLGARNRWRFPRPEVVARYAARRISFHRTDQEGAVTVTIDAGGRITARGVRDPP
jgi:competence protein ComEC